jgi:aryl-alcohol dehydrogenase-like predicted oxidoreductase
VAHNLALADRLREVAEARKMTVAQLAVAWALARGADIVPLVGARTRAQLTETLLAQDFSLTQEDLAAVERAVPAGSAAGDRYPRRPMTTSADNR